MLTLIKNIKQIVGINHTKRLHLQGKEMADLETLNDAYLIVEDEKIKAFGPMADFANPDFEFRTLNFDIEYDASGRLLFPSFCDRANMSSLTRFADSVTRR